MVKRVFRVSGYHGICPSHPLVHKEGGRKSTSQRTFGDGSRFLVITEIPTQEGFKHQEDVARSRNAEPSAVLTGTPAMSPGL